MPTKEVSFPQGNIISLSVPENFTVNVLHLGKSEIHLKVTPDGDPFVPPPAIPTKTSPSEIPTEVMAWCDKKGIRENFLKALEIVRTDFPDLRNEIISLEEHEVLEWSIRIQGQAPGTPEEIARRTWDCIGRWATAIPREASVYFLLGVYPEME